MSIDGVDILDCPIDKDILLKSFLYDKSVKDLLEEEKSIYRDMSEFYRNRMREIIQAARVINPNLQVTDVRKWKLLVFLWVLHGIRSKIRLPGGQRNLTDDVPDHWNDDSVCWIGGLIHKEKDFDLTVLYKEYNRRFSVRVEDVACPKIGEGVIVDEIPQNLDSNDLVEVNDDLRRIEFILWKLSVWIQPMIYFRTQGKAYGHRPYEFSSLGSSISLSAL